MHTGCLLPAAPGAGGAMWLFKGLKAIAACQRGKAVSRSGLCGVFCMMMCYDMSLFSSSFPVRSEITIMRCVFVRLTTEPTWQALLLLPIFFSSFCCSAPNLAFRMDGANPWHSRVLQENGAKALVCIARKARPRWQLRQTKGALIAVRKIPNPCLQRGPSVWFAVAMAASCQLGAH